MVVRKTLFLLAVLVSSWGLALLPAYLLLGKLGMQGCTLAAVICAVPAIASLLVCEWASGLTPAMLAYCFLGGSVVRVGFVVAADLVVQSSVSGFDLSTFTIWLAIFYFVGLSAEVLLLTNNLKSPGVGGSKAA